MKSRAPIVAMIIAGIMFFAVSCPTVAVVGAEPEYYSPQHVDGLFVDSNYRHVEIIKNEEGLLENGIEYDSLKLGIITSLISEEKYLQLTFFNESNVVFDEIIQVHLNDETGLDLVDPSIQENVGSDLMQPAALPLIAIAAALLASLSATEIAFISSLFVAAVIAIEYDSLKASIENYYNKEKPEVVITEEHFDPGITVIFIDGVPSIVHNDRTDEAGTFVDFEFETIKGLNKDDYYVTTFLDDDAMICPLPLEFEPAMWIIEFNSPFLHIWTFNPNNAADVGCGYDGGCDAHTFPFMECLECSIQWGHWHPTGSLHGVRYYSNSVALFGLYYDDSDTYEEEDR